MLADQHQVTRSSVGEQVRPGVGIPLLNLLGEQGRELLIAEICAIGLGMVLRGGATLEPQAILVPLGIRRSRKFRLNSQEFFGEVLRGRCKGWNAVKPPNE